MLYCQFTRAVSRILAKFIHGELATSFKLTEVYRIYSINRSGRLLNFWTSRVGAYSSWALIKFLPFSASERMNEC